MDISDALHALGLNVAHCLHFFPSDYAVAFIPCAYNMQPIPNI